MKKRFRRQIGVLAAAALLLLSACAGSASEDTASDDADAGTVQETGDTQETSSESVIVNIAAETTGLGYYQSIEEANGIADEIGVDLNWVQGLSTGPESIAAITGGSVDIAVIGDFPVVTTYGNEGADFIVIGYTQNTNDSAIFVSADSGITDISGLAGLTIGTHAGTGSQLLLEQALAEAGLTTDDVEIVYLDAGSWQSAFIGGEVDAMCTSPMQTVDNEEIGEVNIIYETGLALSSVIADKEWVEEHPEEAARALLVLSAVWDAVEEDEDAAAEAVLANYDITDGQIRYIFETTENTLLQEVSDEQVARYEEIKAFALENGTIENDFDISEVYDNTYIQLANSLIE